MFVISLIYFASIFFDVLGYVISLTNSCYVIACSDNNPTNNTNRGILKYIAWKGLHECCSCNLNSGNYLHYDEYFIGSRYKNSCEIDANIDYGFTGLMFFLFGVVSIFVLCLIVYHVSRHTYSCIIKQWEEYISKKIDARVRNLNGKQYMRLDVKDSNILYENDIEQGTCNDNTYYQQTLHHVINESDNESDISDCHIQFTPLKSNISNGSMKIESLPSNSDDCVFVDYSDCDDTK